MDLKAALKDKRLLAVAGIGGVAGVYVLVKGGGAGGGTTVAGDAGVAGTGQVPTFNDGGSDIAAALGNFSTELQGILQNYADTLNPKPPTKPAVPPKARNAVWNAAKKRAAAEAAKRQNAPVHTTSTDTNIARLSGIARTNAIHAAAAPVKAKKK